MNATSELPALFARLNTTDPQEVEDVCVKIRKTLAGPSGYSLLFSEEVRPALHQGLNHPVEEVQRLVLEELDRLTKTKEGVQLLITEQFLPAILKRLAGELPTLELSNKILVTVAASDVPAAHQALFSDKNLELLQEYLHSSETIRFRALDLVARLSAVSANTLERVRNFLDVVVDLMRTDDILQQLNVVQIVDKIADSKQGMDYLVGKGIYTSLADLLLSEDPMASLLIPSILSTFSNVAKKEQIDFDAVVSPKVFEAIIKHLNNDNTSCEEAALVALGALGHHPHGLLRLTTDYQKLLKDWLLYARTANTTARQIFLLGFADLLECVDSEETEKVAKLFEETVSSSLVQTLLKLLEQPFEQQRYAVFGVMRSIATHAWGVNALLGFPGVFEFLTNRGTETTKPGSEWKYGIIEALVSSGVGDETKKVVGPTRFLELTKYLKDGVFYVPAESRVLVAAKSV